MSAEGQATLPVESQRARIMALLRDASLEVSAKDPLAGEALRDVVAPPATIYINYAPSDNHHGIVAAASRLRRAGFDPVPHVVARSMASFTQLNDYLRRLAGDAGVTQALVVAGDAARPVGPYESTLEILSTGLFEQHGICRLGVAGYPEGHPRIGQRALETALQGKLALAREKGLALHIVTQFGFDGAAIVAWIRRCRTAGIDRPVRIGLAGPASIATLAKFAIRCGVGQSLRTLATGHSSLTRLLTEAGPEPVIRDLAFADDQSLNIAGLHFFTFGGVGRTTAWMDAIRRGDFAIAGARGFQVPG
jgi:methylenetetrahydrofolate reductase (NADPH)